MPLVLVGAINSEPLIVDQIFFDALNQITYDDEVYGLLVSRTTSSPAHFLDPPVVINYRGKLFPGNFCPKIA